MLKQIALPCLLIAITSFSSCGQRKTDCKSALKKKLSIEISEGIGIIKECGDFSGDDTLLLHPTILAPQIVLLANDKNATYGNLIDKLDEIRHNENYPTILLALKRERDAPNQAVKPKAATASFIEIKDYQAALKEAKDNHKPLFLYFTSKNSMQSRQMENGILADDEVKMLLDNYTRYSANVDQAAVEKFQTDKFGSYVQPYFVIIVDDKKLAEFTGSTKDKAEFTDFLKKGLK